MKNAKITIMLAEDHNSARQAYAGMLSIQENFDVIGQAENGKVLLDLVEKKEPDIVLLDLEMPVMSGRTALVVLKQHYPKVKTIVLSQHSEKIFIVNSILDGASGFLSKGRSLDEVFETINKVYTEGFFFDGSVSRNVIVDLLKKDKTLLTNILSEREIEILKLYCDGRHLKEIAGKLYISVDTVKYHMKNIHKKTQIDSVQKLVKFAIKNAITDLD